MAVNAISTMAIASAQKDLLAKNVNLSAMPVSMALIVLKNVVVQMAEIVIIYPVNVIVRTVGRVPCARTHVLKVNMGQSVCKSVSAKMMVNVIQKVVNVIVHLVGPVMCVLIVVQIASMARIANQNVNALMVHIVIMLPANVNVYPVSWAVNAWIYVPVICTV